MGQAEETPRDDQTAAYDYDLPSELIADRPAGQRDESRLMVIPADSAKPALHRRFRDLPDYMRSGDVLVLNDSKVIPARLFGHRVPGGGLCEILLLEPNSDPGATRARWNALVRPGKKLKPGTEIQFGGILRARIEEDSGGGERVLSFDRSPAGLREVLDILGHMPLPPYILARRGERTSREEDRERYQTVYAEHDGSVAAPTAGLHFTHGLLNQIQGMGVEIVRVTLHVGAGTFQPITAQFIRDHELHTESYRIAPEDADAINRAKSSGRRIVAVGTTSVRTLESALDDGGRVRAGSASTGLMIAPGYRFRVVDALVTNFHLPKSSLLCLVSALLGRERLLACYEEAVRERYRFYSYGDSMFILDR